MYSVKASRAFDDHFGSVNVQDPYQSQQPVPKRKVIVLKPLQENPRSPALACLGLHPAIRSDSDCTSSSPLSFSPTSVLPRQREQGAGNLFKALKQETHKPAAVVPGVSLQGAKQQVLGSWADNQVTHDLSGHCTAVQPLPGECKSVPTSGPIVIHPHIKRQQPEAPVINKRSTLDAAWHWKFKRHWGREQLKYRFLKHSDDDDDEAGNDPWHDALHMIQAATTSPAAGVPICDHDCYADPSPSPLLDSDDLDGLLEAEPLPGDKAGLSEPEISRSSSSRALAEAASKARELRKYQATLQLREEQAFGGSCWLDQPLLALKTRHPR
ncbi:hypothetical protein ABBQ38_011720 [Trebouxia sp. C0009 RCD-2024]